MSTAEAPSSLVRNMSPQAITGSPVPAPDGVDPTRVWLRFVRLQYRASAAMASRLKALGLSIPQFDALSTLTERDGITQQELAERLYVTKGNVSGLIDRLVASGFVARGPVPGDRRSHALSLTPAGRSAAVAGIAAQRAFVEETLGLLPPDELKHLFGALGHWRDRVRALED